MVVTAVLAAVTTTVATGCSSVDRRAVRDAQLDGAVVEAVVRDAVERDTGAEPEQIVEAVEQELSNQGQVRWWERSSTGGGSAAWQLLVVGSAEEQGVIGYESVFANLCVEITLEYTTREVRLTDVDCPEEADAPRDGIDADLAQ
ncbi:hypothetical protein CTKZ_03270 [Cellulomonas algicola]|uniref:Uncharacterized protein n=1 Tax=Cellulomonas algicola TaxID=2071633 RepID=A0A401UVQ1_9CELL|nr:hypothetical protein CTKZ_03270 [Cellulomonas algicola]